MWRMSEGDRRTRIDARHRPDHLHHDHAEGGEGSTQCKKKKMRAKTSSYAAIMLGIEVALHNLRHVCASQRGRGKRGKEGIQRPIRIQYGAALLQITDTGLPQTFLYLLSFIARTLPPLICYPSLHAPSFICYPSIARTLELLSCGIQHKVMLSSQ
jgi:hypothetical protein